MRPHATEAAPADVAGSIEECWSDLGAKVATKFEQHGIPRRYRAGQAIFHKGQRPDQVLLLRTGRVKVITITSAGREVVLAFRGPRDLVGEQAAIDGQERSATVCAVEPVEALSLPVSEFMTFVEEHPDVWRTLTRMLSLRLRDSDAKRIELSAFTTIERVAARLLELADRFGRVEGSSVRISLPLTQEELAGATGASIESVGRALQTMRSLKCLETRRREIRILDLEALDALRRAAG
jgi:CRP/FNR family cyclic AMP-dependent transcriptional regulator